MSNSNLPVTQEPQTPLAPALAREFGLQLPPEQQAAFDAYDERNLQASWGAALETDPGMRAEAETHARALGQPVESVAENMDIARKMVKERQLQYRELRDRYPALLDRFSDVKFASVAHDDIGNLKLVEGSFDWLKRSWNAGRAQNEYGWIGTRRMLGMDSREDRIRAAVIEKRGILDGGDGWAESVVKTFSQMAGSMANSLGAGAAAGVAATAAGPYAPVASPVAFTWATGAAFITQAAAVEGGSHYNELRRQGYSHETSQVSGLGVGLINGALEAVGAKIAAAPFKAAYRNVFLKNAEAAIVKGLAERTAGASVAGFGREYLKVLAAETATETMQEFVTMAGERIARERERPDQSPMTWAEIGTRTGDVFVQTVQAMSVLGLPGPGAQFISDSMRANQAMRGKELLEKLAKGANASELAKRSPDRFRQFVAKAAEGTDAQEMFIEPEQLRAVLEQTGVTEEQLGALVPDVVAQLEQADADGGPVSIPTDLFAANLAKTDIGAAMIPHVKFTQTGFTVSQGEKFQADAPKMAEQASAEYEKLKADMDAVKESVREVESGLRAQLLATGKFDKRSADAAASYYGSFVALQAARAKMLPSEFAAKYPLSVVRGEAPTGAVVRQDGMAKTDSPEFKAWFQGSRVVDETGAPLVVYHGTNIAFQDFSKERVGSSTDQGKLGAGFYFSEDSRIASSYATLARAKRGMEGPQVYPVYLSMKNPLAISTEAGNVQDKLRQASKALGVASDPVVDRESNTPNPEWAADFSRALRERGHDGVTLDFGAGRREHMVLDPEQIKSVNNSGAFDPTNPNILKQTGDRSKPIDNTHTGEWILNEGYRIGKSTDAGWRKGGWVLLTPETVNRRGGDPSIHGTEPKDFPVPYVFHRGRPISEGGSFESFKTKAELLDAINAEAGSGRIPATRDVFGRGFRQTTKGTFDPASFTVTLTADADSSTVLHEFGHAFLTMMADLASQQDAPAETVADVQTVLDWFGVKDVATWNAMTLAEQTPHHEAFARSFEVYLFDGKAPSEEMEGIFRRFAKWVRAAYRNIRDNVNAAYRAEFGRDLPFLTPEVRGVFDRMVASEDAIAQAEALRSMQPMFATEEEFTKANPDAGPSGWAAYQAAVAEAHELAVMDHTRASLRQMKWLTGAKSRTLKALQREGKAARAVIEEQERAKALSEPVYRVGSWLARGEMTNADGTVEVEPGPDHKLDLDAVKALVGIKVKEKAPKKVKVVADTEAAKKARTDRLLAAAKNKRKSLITRIRELGGISRHSWETSYPGERKGEYKIRGVVRGKNDGTKAFRTVGIPWENMAQILRGEGYGPQDQDPSDFSWFVDALTDATFGIQTYREYDYIQQTAAEPDARAPESPEERKARLADEKEALAERAAIQDEETFQATIDPWDLNAASPEDAIDRLGTGKYGMLRRGGLGVEEVAKMFGYDSGEQMVVALLNAKQPDSIIAERTDARMIEEHGNLVPGSDEMEDAITEALHNEARARFVATEWRHLAKAGQPINQVRRQLRASASRQLAAMATGRISPHQFALAEANAARESMRASKAGKFDDALLWKRKQLMQGELAKQATKVRAEIDKAREDWKRFAAADSKVAETRNIDLVNAGRVLGAAYGLTKPPETAQQATIWRQAIVDTAKNHQVIGGQLQGLMADGVAPWKDVPLERFRDVAEMGSALWDLARRVNEVEANGRKVALQEASAELRAQVGTLPERAKSTKAPGGETPSGPTRWILRGWNAVASLKRMEHWARFMDGGKDGPFMAYLVQPVMRALQRYRDAKAGIIAEMHPRLMALAKASGKAWDANIDAPELGKGHTFRGIKEVVGAMMHTGSDSNRFKLLGDKVRQWCPVYDDPETGGKFVDTKNWDAFIGRMHQEGRITKEHWDYVNFVWSTYAKVLPDAQKTHKALYGREFETIELRPVETPFGTYPGGYVPATTDRDEVSQPRPAESIEGIAGMEQNFEWSVSTGKGFTIERNPNYAQPLVLNVARQLIGIDSELRFIHLQPTIRDVLRLSRERQFADVLSAYDRDAANAIITPWLENTATQASSRPSDIPLVDTLASLLRRGTSLAALGLNFFNALIQVTGISNARGEVKGRYMRSALGLWFKGPAKAYQDAAARSDYFRQRMDAKTKVMAQDIARMGDPGFVPGLKVTRDKLGNAAFFPQRLMQGIADTVTWHAAYAQAFAEGKSNVLATSEQMEAYAVEQADSVLRRVQGSQNPEDLAAYEAGTPLAKLFTQFGSYSNTVLNQLMGAQKGSRARIALWALVMPAMIEATLRAFLSGKVDKDDDDKYLDDLAMLYGKSLLRNATGLIPGAGPLVLSLGESEGSRLSATPAGTTLQSAVQGMFAAANVAAGEDLTSYQIRNLGTLLTILSGLPLSPISRALGYAQDVEDGKAEPSGPIDYGRGLVTGQR